MNLKWSISSFKLLIFSFKLNSFIGVTGATLERAKFYLETANGDLDARIFFNKGPKKITIFKYPSTFELN